ncbi:MFS transporter (plasmid) [Bacillus cereus]|uniref:MFS transporter n=1 Tax=Bacillus cereus TaxID=1396 RepID=UPI003DA7BA75
MKSEKILEPEVRKSKAFLTIGMNKRNIRLFYYSQIAYGLSTCIFDMLYSLHLTGLGISDPNIGTLFFIGFLAMAILVLPLGSLADRISPNGGMWFSSLGFGITMLLIPFITSYSGQIIAFVLASVFSAVMLTTSTGVMARHTPDERERLGVFQIGFLMFLISSALGAVIGGWLVEVLPKGNTSYQWALIVSGIIGIFIGLFRIILVIMYPLSPIENMKKPKVKSQIKVKNYKPAILMLVLAALVGAFSVLGIRFSTIILVNHFKLPVTDMGILVSIDKILSILGIVVLARYIKSGKEAKIAGILMIVVLPLQIVGAFSSTAIAFAIPFLLTRGLYYSQAPILDWVTNHIATDDHRTFMNSIERLGLFVGSALGSQLYGSLLQPHFSFTMVCAGIFAGLAGIIYWIFSNMITKKTT